MPVNLCTAAEVRAECRIDTPDSNTGDPDGAWIATWIAVVSAAVAGWLKDEWRLFVPMTDSNGEILRDSNDDPIPSADIHPLAKGAALREIAVQFRYREGEGQTAVPSHEGYGYTLSRAATAILSPLRKPTVR